MALPEVKIIKGEGGIGRPLEGEDHYSAFLFYSSTLPSGFSTNDRIKVLYSLQDAEKLGIKGDYSNETKATGNILVTAVGTAGDKIEVKVTEGLVVKSIGTYTMLTGDTVNTIADGIRNAINSGYDVHGYRAAGTSPNVSITAPIGSGVNANSYTLANTITGTITTTITALANGANDPYVVFNYHISEYFRMQPKGVLYIGIYAVPGSYTFTELSTMNVFADGKIRQAGVFVTSTTLSTTQIQSLQAVAASEEAVNRPFSIIYGADISSLALSALSDLRTLSCPKVSVSIGQDGAAKGAQLYKYTSKSVTTLGALLGAVSYSKVSDNIGWVEKFNIANVELDTPYFANNVAVKTSAQGLLDQLHNYGYIYLRKFNERAGTYFNYSTTATVSTSDYYTIENNRTIDKALRNLRTVYIPKLNSPLKLGSNGKLRPDVITYFKTIGQSAIQDMLNNEEVSAFEVLIDPNQNVLSTSKLVISLRIVPIGVAKTIEVNLSYTVKIA